MHHYRWVHETNELLYNSLSMKIYITVDKLVANMLRTMLGHVLLVANLLGTILGSILI